MKITLPELLIVLLIVGLLVWVAIPTGRPYEYPTRKMFQKIKPLQFKEEDISKALQTVIESTDGTVDISLSTALRSEKITLTTTKPRPFIAVVAAIRRQIGAELRVWSFGRAQLFTAQGKGYLVFRKGEGPAEVRIAQPNDSFERTPPAPRLVIPFAVRSHSFVPGQGHFGYHGM